MTDPRQTFVFAFEDQYAVAPKNGIWLLPPPGSYFTSSHSRDAERVNEVGRKKWADINYGKVTGTWEWAFYLDYNFLEPFLAVFEDYSKSSYEYDENGNTWDSYAVHTFKKSEDGTVPSFTVKRKQLNRIVGGDYDEESYLYGCVCTTMKMSQQAGTSVTQVRMSGIYSYDEISKDKILESLDRVDGRTYNFVEYTCAYADGSDDAWGIVNNWAIQVGNSVRGIYGICNPYARSYYEGQTSNVFSMTVLSNSPDILRRRVLTGGQSGSDTGPRWQGAAPMGQINLRSTKDKTVNINGTEYTLQLSMDIEITDCVVNAMSWGGGEDKIMDQLSGGKSQDIWIQFVNEFPYDYRSVGSVVSDGSTPEVWGQHRITEGKE